MNIGYARTWPIDQTLDRQVQALRRAGCNKIFREKLAGANRPEFQRLLAQLGHGDTVIVWKLDRLARSTRGLVETMKKINEAGARFQSLSEPWANTTTRAAKPIMAVFAGIAEFERDLIRGSISAGRQAARLRGARFGRPRKLNPEQTNVVHRLIDEGRSVREIADTFNVHTATIYRLSATAT